MDVKTLERCCLFSGIFVSLLAYLSENFISTAAGKGSFLSLLQLDTSAVVFAAAFFLLNLYVWKKFLEVIMERKSTHDGQLVGLKLRMLLFAIIKMSLLVLLFFVVFRAPKQIIYSFVVGFSASLFLGVLLSAIFGNIRGQ